MQLGHRKSRAWAHCVESTLAAHAGERASTIAASPDFKALQAATDLYVAQKHCKSLLERDSRLQPLIASQFAATRTSPPACSRGELATLACAHQLSPQARATYQSAALHNVRVALKDPTCPRTHLLDELDFARTLVGASSQTTALTQEGLALLQQCLEHDEDNLAAFVSHARVSTFLDRPGVDKGDPTRTLLKTFSHQQSRRAHAALEALRQQVEANIEDWSMLRGVAARLKGVEGELPQPHADWVQALLAWDEHPEDEPASAHTQEVTRWARRLGGPALPQAIAALGLHLPTDRAPESSLRAFALKYAPEELETRTREIWDSAARRERHAQLDTMQAQLNWRGLMAMAQKASSETATPVVSPLQASLDLRLAALKAWQPREDRLELYDSVRASLPSYHPEAHALLDAMQSLELPAHAYGLADVTDAVVPIALTVKTSRARCMADALGTISAEGCTLPPRLTFARGHVALDPKDKRGPQAHWKSIADELCGALSAQPERASMLLVLCAATPMTLERALRIQRFVQHAAPVELEALEGLVKSSPGDIDAARTLARVCINQKVSADCNILDALMEMSRVKVPGALRCPLSGVVFADPVLGMDGETYERQAAANARPRPIKTFGDDNTVRRIVLALSSSDSTLAQALDENARCVATGNRLARPVVLADGHVYERDFAQSWFAAGKSVSPKTGAKLSHNRQQAHETLGMLLRLVPPPPTHHVRIAIREVEFTTAPLDGRESWTQEALGAFNQDFYNLVATANLLKARIDTFTTQRKRNIPGLLALRKPVDAFADPAAAMPAARNASLTDAQRRVLHQYVGDSNAINGALRKGRAAGEHVALAADLALLQAAVENASLGKDAILYRGIKVFNNNALLCVQPGDIIREPGFSSTSLRAATAHSFAGAQSVLLQIAYKGHQPALDVTRGGASGYESEVILPPDSRFRVEQRRYADGYHIIDCTLL